jgi:ribulose-phosphate 3-epimerase
MRPGKIAASIAAADLGKLREEINDIDAAGADAIHIDIMDGSFVPNLTFGPWVLDVVRSVSRLPLDCHLMVTRPSDWIPILADAGADFITIHIESTPHIHRQIEAVKKLGKNAGVSINPGTPISAITELLDWVDGVQIMSVDPGFSGQLFLRNSLKKIEALRALREDRAFRIEADGGITSNNIASVYNAGADVFVLGSYLFSHPNRREMISSLKTKVAAPRANRYGA